jgi:hypothetical protein
MKILPKVKILSIFPNFVIGSKNYKLYKFSLEFEEIEKYAKVIDPLNSFFSAFKLLKRFFRAEITNLYTLSDGTELIIAKKGIFKRQPTNKSFIKCFKVTRGSRPLNLCIDQNSKIFFGEYFRNKSRDKVFIYCSSDKGVSWQICYIFKEREIKHVHGIFFDPFTGRKWIVTGDNENECIIGYTEDDFKSLIITFRGGQEFRVCTLLFYESFIVFATDSPFIKNEIKLFYRDTLEVKSICYIQGSAIKGGQCGKIGFISTTVEKSTVNTSKHSHLWFTTNGIKWNEIYSDEKDNLPYIFQFGSIEFPTYKTDYTEKLYFSGRALKNIGNSSTYITLPNG